MELMDAILSRHSVRSFDSRPVPKEMLDGLFEAAAAAPSAFNEQPWHFFVLEADTKERFLEIMAQNTNYLEEFMALHGHEVTPEAISWYSELGNAPVVVACAMPNVDDELLLTNKYLSVGAALQNLQLAATSAGLASCAATFSYWVRDEIADLLNVPDGNRIVALVAVGFPGDQEPVAPGREHDIVTYLD